MTTMSATFPTAKKLGYSPAQVDAFLDRARAAYDGGGTDVTAADIRGAAFDFERHGYDPQAVDAALERLENVFAEREREEARRKLGDSRYMAQQRELAQAIVDRLGRPDGNRFDRAGGLTFGYSRRDVDRFARRLIRYFREGRPMSVDEVRHVVFRPERHGYREAQVDAVLDAVVEVMLSVG